MIRVFISGDKKEYTFQTPYNALRFMYMMRHKGFIIEGYACDDPYDHRWIERRFKL